MTFDERAGTLTRDEIAALLASHEQLEARVTELTRQLDWFKQQLFGQKSERRPLGGNGRQLALGEALPAPPAPPPGITVAEHQRRRSSRSETAESEEPLRFDATVPVEEIRLPAPALDDDHELVSEKVTYRLAQKPASYVVLKYIRPVVKTKIDGTLSCPPAPVAVLGRSLADVSLLAGLVIDKFLYHLPLYRQHQRMEAAGIHLGRSTLTSLVHRTGDLLEPIYEALLASIRSGRVIAMDETPIKAGRDGPGKMKQGYFWPLYGDQAEVAFPFAPTRSHAVVRELLAGYQGVLLSDGYEAYQRFAEKQAEVVHAQCWSHTRRQFLTAEGVEPDLTETALTFIRQLYEQEALLRPKLLEREKRLEWRALHCKPIVAGFFEWLKGVLRDRILLPRNPFTEAAGYALAREKPLQVFLEDPDVPIDTNHLERQIRPISVGRKNWLFCWTEVGARYVGVFQSLLATCRLQGVDPYTYLVDVLQRVDSHPANDVAALTPRLWKDRFAAEPLRSAIDPPVYDAVR